MGSAASRAGNKAGSRLKYANKTGQQQPVVLDSKPELLATRQSAAEVAPQTKLSGVAGVLPGDPGDELQRDPVMSKFLDQLGGSIANRAVPPAARETISGLPKYHKAEAGGHRLGLLALKSLLVDSRSPRNQKDGSPDVEKLAEEFGINAKILGKVLRHNAVPLYREGEDGRVYGTWP